MIRSFLHKGLKRFYLTGSTAGIENAHRSRLRMILSRLEVLYKVGDMNLPGFAFHQLTGDKKGQYTVKVDKNWRIVFKFNGVDVYDVDYLDYH